MTSVHSEESVKGILSRRARTGAPTGECGNCANAHGHPRNCLSPKSCIHGWSRARSRQWAEDNPDWGKPQRAASGGFAPQ